MNIICSFNDKMLLGKGGISKASPRYTARAILKRNDGMYALIYTKKFHMYMFPGGGIESSESPTQAVIREVAEETGYVCDFVRELGVIYENRAYCNYTQYSHYFYATTDGNYIGESLTDIEVKNGTSIHWFTLEKAIELITSHNPTTNQQRYLQARDIAALKYYLKQKDNFE